jgi:hypothetical protein
MLAQPTYLGDLLVSVLLNRCRHDGRGGGEQESGLLPRVGSATSLAGPTGVRTLAFDCYSRFIMLALIPRCWLLPDIAPCYSTVVLSKHSLESDDISASLHGPA